MIDATKTPRQSMLKVRFFLLVVGLFTAPAWAINKCIGPDGRVVYQATACPGSGEIVGNEIARRETERKAAAQREQYELEASRRAWAQHRLDEQTRLQSCKGQIHDVPFVGMTVHAMENCTRFWERYGAGARVNETETALGIRRQYVFNLRDNIRYLYTANGIVTAIQR